MNLILGEFPDNESFNPDREGWNSIKEPKNVIIYQLLAIPLAIIITLLITMIVAIFTNTDIDFGRKLFIQVFISYILIVPVHEILHALGFPSLLKSDEVFMGFNPKGFVFFAHYIGHMSRNRFLFVLVFPFIILSILPVVIMSMLSISNSWIFMIVIVNTLASSGDLLGFLIILFQVPRVAIVKNKGLKTYWKRVKF